MFKLAEEKLSPDAYWLGIEHAELIEIPPTMFMWAGAEITKMEPYVTSVFDRESASPIGNYFFLVDRARGATLCAYSYMDQASKPIWVDGVDPDKAAVAFTLECRRNDWRFEDEQ